MFSSQILGSYFLLLPIRDEAGVALGMTLSEKFPAALLLTTSCCSSDRLMAVQERISYHTYLLAVSC